MKTTIKSFFRNVLV